MRFVINTLMTPQQTYYAKNKDLAKQRAADYINENRELHNSRVADYSRRNPEVGREASKRYLEKNRGTLPYKIKQQMTSSKRRAKDKGLDFNLDFDYLMSILPVDLKCPVFGTEFVINSHEQLNDSMTLDRIDSSKGYVRGNVQFISWRANNLKSDATLQELKTLLEYLERV